MIPTTLKGKEFEELLLHRARYHDEPKGNYMLNRYGVMASFNKGNWTPIKSLPDFDMVVPPGFQCVFDTKVCSQPAYDLSGGTSKSFKHQYKFMQRKSLMGAACFLLMHFNKRELKTRTDEAFTTLFPVRMFPFWEEYETGERKKLTRDDAKTHGIEVEWTTTSDRGTKFTPDLLTAVKKYREKLAYSE